MECSSPRRFITRLLRRMTARKSMPAMVTMPSRRGSESCDGAENSKDGGSTAGSQGQEREASPPVATMTDTVVPGNSKKGNVVNLGVACSLFYLAMESKTELEMMKELRREMQSLLGQIKEELQGKNHAPEPSEVVESPTSCLTDAGAMPNCSSRTTSFVFTEEETVTGGRPSGSDKSKQECVQEIDQLESELEAELERLQLHLDSGSPSKRGQQHSAKTKNTDSARATSGSVSMGEVTNPNDGGHSGFQGGVPPIELERKLHQLLESRQEERIKELETVVECYKRELSEKEKEISWWRDTALLLSHRSKESPSRGI